MKIKLVIIIILILIILLGCSNIENRNFMKRTKYFKYIDVIAVSGTNATDNSIDILEILVKSGPGSDPINLSDLKINIKKNSFQNYTYKEFDYTIIQNGTNYEKGILNKDDVYEFSINLNKPILENESFNITINSHLEDILPKQVNLRTDNLTRTREWLYP